MRDNKELKSGYKVVFEMLNEVLDYLNDGIRKEEIDKKLYDETFDHILMTMDFCKKYDLENVKNS
ncbi:hypothetical protein ACWNT8_15480 (plasmid) [Pigmentibacter ruber]